MNVYLRANFEASSIILIHSFRQGGGGVILPPSPTPPQKKPLKSSPRLGLKRCVYRDVISENCVIYTPKPFAEHIDTVAEGITSLHFPANVLIEPDDVEASLTIKYNLQIHIINWFFDEQNVPYLQFFKMASDEKPFIDNFMGKDLVIIKTSC